MTRDGTTDRPWGRRERPPWWPSEEPFPPESGEHWRHMRAHFFRRLLFGLIAFLIFVLVVVGGLTTLLVLTVSAALGAGTSVHPAGLVVAVIVVVFLLALIARSVRRFGGPLGDLVEAAGRVEAGDYAARVRERGPREIRALARAFNDMSARLQRSETERRRLLADVTHELRTPLTVMQGNVEALIDGVHPADPEHLAAILDETRVLSRLIDDLRTLSLAESRALALHREPVDAEAIVRDAIASFAPQADAAGIRLGVEVEAGLPPLDADPVRAREVLTNVVANALRYTPRGGSVDVSVVRAGSMATVTIRDTGPGIAAEVLPHVFERFARSPTSPGAGLGLAIAKGIVETHGGTIAATSDAGRGTEIRFTLPLLGPSG